ncbi:hypothetical protein [Paraclostridium sordellii]|uniref:hypothetical protein n=2 Tax=Paraclostridium sordellii TaxID=1505 RepID=UPI0005E6E488|nr:hypothetical protein [Paeniclostridium sordellii]CEO21354.1 Uncharacterised protein [[Clostridium] sordellii] [Paeniclostridium sordellii]
MHKLENIMDNAFNFLYKSQEKRKRNAKLNREGTLFLFRYLLMPFTNLKEYFSIKKR